MPKKIDLIKQYAALNCLIVDDLPGMRGMIKRVVDNQGMKRVDTAATAAVINTAADHVNTNDRLRIDVDAVHTTPAQGGILTLGFSL